MKLHTNVKLLETGCTTQNCCDSETGGKYFLDSIDNGMYLTLTREANLDTQSSDISAENQGGHFSP